MMLKAGWIMIALAAAAAAGPAHATPCGSGTIAISATSDTPLTGLAYNVGQKAIFDAQASGIAPVDFLWTIPGPHIQDYQDSLGTTAFNPMMPGSPPPPAAPTAWSTTPVTGTDLAHSTVSLYWRPSPAQTHPNAGPPETRTVTLRVELPDGTICVTTTNVTVERNLTDPNRQPEDYYTSTHRAATTTNPGNGGVMDEHIHWHRWVGGGPPGSWYQFLPWHTYFLRRFNDWRQTFGYPPVAPWYPGRPLPTGAEFDHDPSLRLVYDPDFGRLTRKYTLAGEPVLGSIPNRLADFTSVNNLTGEFEFTFHGQIHCQIGFQPALDPNDPETGFFTTTGPYFGSMCMASSPKDPMFWRWHGFIDRMYGNFCHLPRPPPASAPVCHVAAEPAADPWMGDNAADIAAGGAVPSPGPHWMSPDIWNRRTQVATDACIPRAPPPDLNTVGGVTRDCGSEADHENPVAGTTNYLYATLRNTGRPQRNVYAEVAVYIASASTGLSWPADFTMVPESRQFITLNLEPGQVTDIGPLPWTPPSPTPSDHWCIYIRILSVQEAPLVEGPVVDTNVANSNSIAWRNLKVVNPGERRMFSRFVVRNIRREADALALQIDAAPALMQNGRLILQLDPALQRAFVQAPLPDGVRALGRGRYAVTGLRTILEGLRLPPRGQGVAELQLEPGRGGATGDIVVTQRSGAGVDGGITMRVAPPRRRRPARY